MVMQGSTRGLIIKGLQNLHQFPYQDTAVSTLAQRLLDLKANLWGRCGLICKGAAASNLQGADRLVNVANFRLNPRPADFPLARKRPVCLPGR